MQRFSLETVLPMAFAAASSAMILSASAQEAAIGENVRRFEPSTPWNLDYAEKSCVLKRAFSDEAGEVTLEIRKYTPGEGIQVGVASQDLHFKKVGARFAAIAFLPDPDMQEVRSIHRVSFGDEWNGVVWSDTLHRNSQEEKGQEFAEEHGYSRDWSQSSILGREAEINGIRIDWAFTDFVELATGPLDEAMDVMRHCEDDLLASRGLDPLIYRSLSRKARPLDYPQLAARIIKRYPLSMAYDGQVARVHIRASVDEQGNVTGCEQLGMLGEGNFEDVICREITHNARFEPALDAKGTPVKSDWYTTVAYHLR